jgi:hypothetical protein
MADATCHTCNVPLDAGDRYCRRCGTPVASGRLPAVAGEQSVTVWKPQASPIVKGAAVMAAGTLGQFVLRRMVGGLLARPQRRRRLLPIARRDDGLADEAQIITETVMMRRVRIRRQPG